MDKFILITILIWSIVSLISCVPRRKRNETTKTFHRTGEAIAVDDLIQEYEREHQQFYEKEIKDGDHLEWPALENKNLSTYCRKYLQQSVPGRTTDGATGIKMRITLHYVKENTRITNKILVVQCRIIYKAHTVKLYLTQAQEPNCVYALKSTRNRKMFIITIINKHCDFEGTQLSDGSLKRKRVELIHKIHHKTGQPIAKDEYLLKYELEHQELHKREGSNGKCIEWPHVVLHPNLNSYCNQYIRKCAPNRNREGTTGNWKSEKLQYRKVNTNVEIMVTTVTCRPITESKLRYHITQALEPYCVYALLRTGYGAHSPLIIIFKHCDFEDTNEQLPSHKNDIHKKNIIPKSEVKENIFHIQTS